MNLRRIVFYILTGFTVGAILMITLEKLGLRTEAVGGEVLMLPMIILLVAFGWILKSEYETMRKRAKKAFYKKTFKGGARK